jgi:hypothetical protein
MQRHKTCFVTLAILPIFAMLMTSTLAWSQTCTSGDELEGPGRSAIETAVNQYFQMARQGDTAGLQQAATPDFTAIANTVSDNKDAFSGAPTVRSLFVLDNSAPPSNAAFSGPPPKGGRVEFFCGIFNSPDRVGFVFPSLPPGVYAVVVEDTKSDKGSFSVSWILQQSGNRWELAGLVPKATTVGSHDGNWFAQQARAFKSKGELHNAWLYYVMADELLTPFPAMGTPQLDKLYDEFQPVRPADLPGDTPVDLIAAGKTYKVTTMFPAAVGDAIDLVVKYQTPDLSDTNRLFEGNMALIKAIVTKYPEFRDAFGGVVARAVAPSGQDYGTLLAMKDVK